MNLNYVIKEFEKATAELKAATEALKQATPKRGRPPKAVVVNPEQGKASG